MKHELDPWLAENLRCPRDGSTLTLVGDELVSGTDSRYPVVDGVPVMLVSGVPPTHRYCVESLEAVGRTSGSGSTVAGDGGIDPFVQDEVARTCGIMYSPLRHALTRYPIPSFPLVPGARGEPLLDIGCNWGRWCVSAAMAGFAPVGIDPSLDAVLAAGRVSRGLGLKCLFVVGDSRYLPFRSACFETVFSYSVLQHFSREDLERTLAGAGRVIAPGGRSIIQMAAKIGLRNFLSMAGRGFREPGDFEVRYWSLGDLLDTFNRHIGRSRAQAEGFFSLGSQLADVDMLPLRFRAVVYASELFVRLSRILRPLVMVADSVYLESVKDSGQGEN